MFTRVLVLLMATTLCSSAGDKGIPKAQPVKGEKWYTATVHTIPEGAAIMVDGKFRGYSPLAFRFKTINGYVPEPIIIYCIPTAAGQYTQHGNIGAYGKRITGDGTCTFFMYDSSGGFAQ
jgi:hypothetical protein